MATPPASVATAAPPAFDGRHLDDDSAMYPGSATMALPGGEFFTRWITHICAPTFVFLAGVALALSTERRVAKGANAWDIDKKILTSTLWHPNGNDLLGKDACPGGGVGALV